jgi:hypothetical protein
MFFHWWRNRSINVTDIVNASLTKLKRGYGQNTMTAGIRYPAMNVNNDDASDSRSVKLLRVLLMEPKDAAVLRPGCPTRAISLRTTTPAFAPLPAAAPKWPEKEARDFMGDDRLI